MDGVRTKLTVPINHKLGNLVQLFIDILMSGGHISHNNND